MKLEDSFSLQCLKFYHKFKGNSQEIVISIIVAHVTVINYIIFLLKRRVQANVSDIQYQIY